MTIAYLGVGSNVGDRQDFCRQALAMLAGSPGVHVEATSGLYETSPVGGPPQRSFLNAVIKVSTDLDPRGLLDTCKRIEQALGRGSTEIKWGPRVIDLDVLLFGEEKVNDPDLEIPHPRISQRRFVLVPLLEIDPHVTDPWGVPYSDFLDEAEGDVEYFEPYGPARSR